MPHRPRLPQLFILATILCALTLFAGAGELLFRYVFKNYLYRHFDERNVLYRYDSELGWFPLESSEGTFAASRTVTVNHNSDGFRDTEHGPKDRPRIAVLGDSFVWGFDVEQTERFKDLLDSALTDWDVMNMGVSGYSTDQEYLLIRRFFERYRPDIVLLVFCQINDEADNTTNMIFEGYFKPYYTIEGVDFRWLASPCNHLSITSMPSITNGPPAISSEVWPGPITGSSILIIFEFRILPSKSCPNLIPT